MVELNELALENVVGGEISFVTEGGDKLELPHGVKGLVTGFLTFYTSPCIAAHDMVVSEEKALLYGDAKSIAAGTVLSAATYSALSVGVYEGGKHLYKKIKSKLSSK